MNSENNKSTIEAARPYRLNTALKCLKIDYLFSGDKVEKQILRAKIELLEDIKNRGIDF